jgi:hypothetical protein
MERHDARIQQDGPDTPSSSSTAMISTPPINSSRVTLKDGKSTHSYSPARKDDQLYPHSGSHAVGKGSTGTVDMIADPRTHEKRIRKVEVISLLPRAGRGFWIWFVGGTTCSTPCSFKHGSSGLFKEYLPESPLPVVFLEVNSATGSVWFWVLFIQTFDTPYRAS